MADQTKAAFQSLVDDLYAIFTSTPAEIAERFGETRCTDDHYRINYALELMEHFVTDEPDQTSTPPSEPGAR